VLWLTGLPASGKTTITRKLVKLLLDHGVDVEVLESDSLRKVLTPNPTYSPVERDTFYNSVIYISTLLSRNGINVIIDATGNRRKWRKSARRQIPKYMEIFVDTPLEICKQRDPKGIYELADTGEATYVPGEQQIYEAPAKPDVKVNGTKSADTSAKNIFKAMKENDFI
jgi:adenylylsulfate kinase